MVKNKSKTDPKITYITNTHMDNNTEISIAVMKTDIDYIKKAVDTMSGDIREMKGMFLPLAQAATKEEMTDAEARIRNIEDKVNTAYKFGGFLLTLIVAAIVGAWLKLIFIP